MTMENPWSISEQASIARLYALADVTDWAYKVRSTMPVLDPLITWARYNLTSHLREPYLDPMFERQVAFNQEMVRVLKQLVKEKENSG